MRPLLLLALAARLAAAAAPAAQIAQAIRENSFDRQECYRVRDLRIVREDIRIFLNDGHLIFANPVAGKRIAAVFTADTDDGDGEVLLMPPDTAERRSLAYFSGAPNLNERFKTAVFVFSGNEYEDLKAQIDANPANRRVPELGPVLADQWTPLLRNLGTSYQTRLVLDLLENEPSRGIFAAMLGGTRVGNLDLVFDPRSAEQIVAGQVASRGGRVFFDIWASFESQSNRGKPPQPILSVQTSDYRIEATVSPDLLLSGVTKVKIKPTRDGLGAIPFDIAAEESISEATVDGRPVEILQQDSLRANALRGGNVLFLLVPPEPLHEGREYEVEFKHSGRVIQDAGDRIYYVSARGNWYPIHGLQFASYDLTFRYPREFDLVTAGETIEDRTDGEWRITRRRTDSPIRIAGFNFGVYEHTRVTRGPYEVDVYANRSLGLSSVPAPPPPSIPPPISASRRTVTVPAMQLPPPPPVSRLDALAQSVGSALEFMASKFGPPAQRRLVVSPIPATFGQGFPGLIYLSTLSYVNSLSAQTGLSQELEVFFEDILQAHETAHQWWGNRVIPAAYRDNWLTEALANYSALLYIEHSKGTAAAASIMEGYRTALLATNEGGKTIDSAGPIVLGTRLDTSVEPRAWRVITYGKGSWVLHMLRMRMGDDAFFAMLSDVLHQYDGKEITTEQFRLLAARHMPPKSDDPQLEAFFEHWVYGTGIPEIKLNYGVKGKAPSIKVSGTVTQAGVDKDFTALVPVEIQAARGSATTVWVRTGEEASTFSVTLKQAPLKVVLDPKSAVLRK